MSVLQPFPLEPVLVSPFNSRLYPVIKVIREAKNRMGVKGSSGTDLSLPPAPLNALLTRIFVCERSPLLRSLRDHRQPAFRRGVSLLAIMQKVPVQ
jgi:hypothetical protein